MLSAILVLLGALVVLSLGADDASAQSAFCQQYPDDPSCQGDTGPTGGDDTNDGLLPNLGGDGTPSANDGVGRGELPFTGYPLTGLLLLMLLLLALGMALRLGLAARDRIRQRTAIAQAKAAA